MRLNPKSFRALAMLFWPCAAMVFVSPASAQGARPATRPPSPAPAQSGPRSPANPPNVELSDTPFHLEAVGLTIHFPTESKATTTEIQGQANVQVVPADNTWLMKIGTPRTSNSNSTVKEALDQTIALLQRAVGITNEDATRVLETKAKVLSREDDLHIGDHPAARAYVQLPRGDNTSVIRGFTIFKPGPTQYVVFEFYTTPEGFAAAKAAYEASVGTAQFVDAALLASSRAGAIKAGVRLIQGLTDAEYVAAMGQGEHWQRLYKPAKSGSDNDAEELGYRGLKFWRGKRGEINAELPLSKWKNEDRKEGYLGQLKVRLLQGPLTIDTVGLYFMSPDRAEEAWAIRLIRRNKAGKEIDRWNEVGARVGNDLNVVVTEPSQKSRPIVPFIQGEGYVSQLESYLLPSLITRAAIRDGLDVEFGFYSYNSRSEAISMRRDNVGRDTQAAGAWTLTTRFRDSEDVQPQKSIFNDRGDLIRSDLGDGRVWEPVELPALEKLWKRKGLPTDH